MIGMQGKTADAVAEDNHKQRPKQPLKTHRGKCQ
jgi:hypothetical protein